MFIRNIFIVWSVLAVIAGIVAHIWFKKMDKERPGCYNNAIPRIFAFCYINSSLFLVAAIAIIYKMLHLVNKYFALFPQYVWYIAILLFMCTLNVLFGYILKILDIKREMERIDRETHRSIYFMFCVLSHISVKKIMYSINLFFIVLNALNDMGASIDGSLFNSNLLYYVSITYICLDNIIFSQKEKGK